MAVDDDWSVGFVRAHRWASPDVQRARLRAAGCNKIFDLDKQDRAAMVRVALRQPVRLLYAFLLATPDKTRGMWDDFQRVLERIETAGGSVVDVDSGLDSKANKAAFRAVVADQVRRHNQGEKSADNHPKGSPGRPEAEYRKGDWRKAYQIWKGKDAANFPTGEAARTELEKIISINTKEPFSVARAYATWGKRPERRKK